MSISDSTALTIIPQSSFPTLQKKPSTGFVATVWQKICLVAKAIFERISSLFCCFGSSKLKLEKHEIRLLRDDRPSALIAAHGNIAATIYTSSGDPLESNVDKPFVDKAPTYVTFEPTLEAFRKFARDISVLTVDTLHEKSIKGKLESHHGVDATVVGHIKAYAQFLVAIGDKPSKSSLFLQLSDQDNQEIDLTKKSKFKMLLKEDQGSLEQLYRDLEEKISKEFKEYKISANQYLSNDYIRPILNWILYSDHTQPLSAIFQPEEQYLPELIDKIYDKIIIILIERKIDNHIKALNHALKNRLADIAHETMRINATRLADFFTQRLSELILTIPFDKTFDKLIRDVALQHVQGYYEAEKALIPHRQVLEKAKRAISSKPKNAAELELRTQFENHLASVAKHDSEENYLQQVLVEEFNTQPGCNSSYLKHIIEQRIALAIQEKNPASAHHIHQIKLINHLTNQIFELLMPSKRKLEVLEEVIESDPLDDLWEHIYLPPEFTMLARHVNELRTELVTTVGVDAARFLPVRFEPDDVKNQLKSLLQKKLKEGLSIAIAKCFEKVALPAGFDEMNADSALPAINKQMIRASAGHEFYSNLKLFAPLLHTLLLSDDTTRDEALQSIEKTLRKLTQEKFYHFNDKQFYAVEVNNGETSQLVYEAFSEQEWHQLLISIIEEAEKALRTASINGKPLDLPNMKSHEIVEILQKYSNAPGRPNDEAFGELIMTLLFKIGQAPYEGVAGYFIKDMISREVSNNTQKLRSSYHFLVENITESLKGNFLNAKKLEEIMYGKPQIKLLTQERLKHQISVTAKLAHDLIMRKVNQKGVVVKMATRGFLGDQPHKLTELITTIYQKLFRNQLINESLLVQVSQILFKSMEQPATAPQVN